MARSDSRLPDADDAISLRAAIGELSPRQRQAVILRYFLQLTTAETAEVMARAEGTVRALTAQGLATLRRSPRLDDMKAALSEF